MAVSVLIIHYSSCGSHVLFTVLCFLSMKSKIILLVCAHGTKCFHKIKIKRFRQKLLDKLICFGE